jgi:hypothetical protein
VTTQLVLPILFVRQYLTAGTYREERSDLDNMGRMLLQTLTDSSGGDIKRELTYDARGAVSQISAPYRAGASKYQNSYQYQSLQ